MTGEQFLHDTAHSFRVDMMIDMDDWILACICLRFARVSSLSAPRYIQDGQHFETPNANRLIVDKILGLNRAGMLALCRQTDRDTPAPTSWFAYWDRQAQFTSQKLHQTFTHPADFVLQQLRDLLG